MIQKDSYGFNTFAATRISEIQDGTRPEDWYWIESSQNFADWLTRGEKPSDINLHTEWQEGPRFLQLEEWEWPITRNYATPQVLPEIVHPKITATVQISPVTDNLATRIKIDMYASYHKLLRVTA